MSETKTPSASLTLRLCRALSGVSKKDWDACANPAMADSLSQPPESISEAIESQSEGIESLSEGERFNPFISHDFLSALEESGSVGARAGWSPVHLLVEDGDGALLACAPCYAKTHSQGEYVFDHGWADAYERAGGAYYPKLQVAVPFTPVTGRRLLVAPGPRADEARAALIAGLEAARAQTGASSVHVTFPDHADWTALGEAGWLQRTGEQFHFLNENYRTFDDFLGALASRKRKAIRKERERALSDGVSIEWATGGGITEAHWDAFFHFYMDTGSRKWGRPYLNRRFFSLLGAKMADRILLVMAKREGRFIAGALNLIGDDALYGRNWGAIEHHEFLHFEVCYYQAIDFALARGLKRVEAGAQGEHKLARGYRPVRTFSAHHIGDPRLARAIADYLKRERSHVEEAIELYGEHVPFRRGPRTDEPAST
ncbi:MAG: GNAT family N-acetyltransferase [Proteobacteria bacterium]|nr:GNAT family N-acetyltransferase [Pseudomonadota bacterium]